MKRMLKLGFVLLTVCGGAMAQVEPAATGPGGPPVNGDLTYSLRYSQTEYLYGANQAGGNQIASIASASVDYAHPNLRRPLWLEYSGGYMFSIAGPSVGSGVFQHLAVSQGIVQRRWQLTVGDDVSYTPEAPTTGFSGVPGTGEPIGGSGTGTAPSQSILTINTRTLDNLASVEFGYKLDYATTWTVRGGSQLLRFPTGNGLDSDEQQIGTGLARRIDARTSITGQYLYSHSSYDASPYSDGISGAFEHHALHRRLSACLEPAIHYRRGRGTAVDGRIGPGDRALHSHDRRECGDRLPVPFGVGRRAIRSRDQRRNGIPARRNRRHRQRKFFADI